MTLHYNKYNKLFQAHPTGKTCRNIKIISGKTGNTMSILSYIRYSGAMGFYSLDLYTLLVDLYCHEAIFYTIMGNDSLRTILWDSLWFPEEADRMYQRIRGATISHFYQVLDILKDIKLKPDLMQILWDQLVETGQ